MRAIYTLCLIYISVVNGILDISSNNLLDNNETKSVDPDLIQDKLTLTDESRVKIKLFYECHCPASRQFGSIHLKNAIDKLNNFLEIKTYPYGNAETYEHNGKIQFNCQHGTKECYGNELHACALDIIANYTKALLFNSCMMRKSQEAKGSDDTAADKCGSILGIDSSPIKACAKGNNGTELHKYYGEESQKINFSYVPYVLINGKEYKRSPHFVRDLCTYLSKPPPPCHRV